MRPLLAIAAILIALPLSAAELGDDGLHKTAWMRDTFKDLGEDLEEANAEGKRLVVMIEQRGCIYCTKMHQEVYPDPKIDAMLNEDFFVVQINMFGDVEVTDFDGETLSEKDMVKKWGALFTPTIMFFPETVAGKEPASRIEPASCDHLWGVERGHRAHYACRSPGTGQRRGFGGNRGGPNAGCIRQEHDLRHADLGA